MDIEFNKLQDELPTTIINTTATNEHLVVEWQIWVVKEQGHGIIVTLPFKALPKVVIAHVTHFVTMWLNIYPFK